MLDRFDLSEEQSMAVAKEAALKIFPRQQELPLYLANRIVPIGEQIELTKKTS